MSSWKDWYAFRSQFRREVAGSVEVEGTPPSHLPFQAQIRSISILTSEICLVMEVMVGTGDKLKRIPAKSVSTDFSCLSQPLQVITGARAATKFHFDEYHTLIQGEVYENRSWFYTRSSLGNFSVPVFMAKKRSTLVWVDLEEPLDSQEADYGSQADSEGAVLSDDENHSIVARDALPGTMSPTTGRQVHYSLFNRHYQSASRADAIDDDTLNGEDDALDFDVKSDHSNDGLETHPRGRKRITSGTLQGPKSRSVPTSPKRGRTSSVKSSSSNLAASSSQLFISSGPNSPPTQDGPMALSGSSRPSSPLPTSSPGMASPSDPASPRDSYISKNMKASTEAAGWFPFLSTSPPLPSESTPISAGPKRLVKRVLLQLTLMPVTSSLQDFEIVASISHGALNSPNELFLVKDKDLGLPRFMKIVPVITHRDDDAPPIWEGSKESVAYSTSLTVPMLAHPFLVEQTSNFQTDNKLYLMMEWLGGGELFSVLRRTRHGRFDEHEALFYTAQLVLALEHMHAHKMIYRDLKPENLLLSAEGHLKITQRTPPEAHWNGGARDFSIVTAHSMPEYLAPEILKGLPYSQKADSWSVGTILYHMLVGQPPFQDPNVQHLFASIIADEVNYPSFLSADVTGLLKGLLHRDLKKRFSMKQVKTSEWFDGLDWNKMLRREYAPPLKPFRRQDLNFTPAPARRRTPQRGNMQAQNAPALPNGAPPRLAVPPTLPVDGPVPLVPHADLE